MRGRAPHGDAAADLSHTAAGCAQRQARPILQTLQCESPGIQCLGSAVRSCRVQKADLGDRHHLSRPLVWKHEAQEERGTVGLQYTVCIAMVAPKRAQPSACACPAGERVWRTHLGLWQAPVIITMMQAWLPRGGRPAFDAARMPANALSGHERLSPSWALWTHCLLRALCRCAQVGLQVSNPASMRAAAAPAWPGFAPGPAAPPLPTQASAWLGSNSGAAAQAWPGTVAEQQQAAAAAQVRAYRLRTLCDGC